MPDMKKDRIINPPSQAGRIIAMTEFNGKIYVACENGVYVLVDDEFVPLGFVRVPDET